MCKVNASSWSRTTASWIDTLLGRMMSRNMDRRDTGLRNGRVTPTQDRIHDTSRVGLALDKLGIQDREECSQRIKRGSQLPSMNHSFH